MPKEHLTRPDRTGQSGPVPGRGVVVALVTAVVFGAVLSGCGGGGNTAATTTTVVTTQTTTEASADATTGQTIPDVTGDRLDVAESKLDDLRLAYKEVGGGTFGIVVRSNWVVCDQDPPIGAQGRSVKLIVDRPGECGATSKAGPQSGSARSLPDLTGLRLDVAESKLDDLGIAYDEVGGGLFGIVDRSNWEVCEQDPGPGSSAQRVKLVVDRPGDC